MRHCGPPFSARQVCLEANTAQGGQGRAMMTWTPSPADEVPNPAGIDSLRKLFGLNLSKNAKSKSRQSKGEGTSQRSQEQQQQEVKEEREEEGEQEVELDTLDLSAEAPGDVARATAILCRSGSNPLL